MRIHFLICASYMLLVSADETQKRSPVGETAQASYGVSPGQYVIRTAGPGEESPQLAPGQYLNLLQNLLAQQQGAPPSQAQQHIIRQLLVQRDQNSPAALQYQTQAQLNTQGSAQAEVASLLQQQAQIQNRPDRRPMPASALLQRALQQTYYNDLHARPRPPARFAAYPQAQPPQQLQQQNAAGAFQYIVPQVQLPAVQPLSSSTPATQSAQQPLQGQQHVQLVERLHALEAQRAEEELEARRGAAVEEAQRAAADQARRTAAAEEARAAAQQHAAAQQRAAAAAQREADQERAAAAEQEAAQQRAAAEQREAAEQRAAAAQREAAQQRALVAQREAAQLRAVAAQREAAQQQRAAAAQREAVAQRQREELQAQKSRELQAQQLLATYDDDEPEEVPVEYSDEPAPVVYQRPSTTPPAPRPTSRTRRPPSVPIVEQYLRETTNPEIARNPKPQITSAARRPQSRPLARPIYVPADQGLVSEISQEDKEDVLASLLPGSSPSTPRSSIFVTNKIPIKNSRQGGITIEEVSLDEGPETTQLKSKPVPVVRIPSPEGQRPLTQTELNALIDAGFIVTPVDDVPAPPRRQSHPKRSRPQSQQIPAQQVNQVVYDEPVQLSPIIVPEQLPKRRIRPQPKQQIQVEVPEELRPIPSPRPGFIVRYEEDDTDNSASTSAPRLRGEYGSKTRRQRTRRPIRPTVEQQDER